MARYILKVGKNIFVKSNDADLTFFEHKAGHALSKDDAKRIKIYLEDIFGASVAILRATSTGYYVKILDPVKLWDSYYNVQILDPAKLWDSYYNNRRD